MLGQSLLFFIASTFGCCCLRMCNVCVTVLLRFALQAAAIAARANPRPFVVFLVPSLERLDNDMVTPNERQIAAILFTNDHGASGELVRTCCMSCDCC